MKNQKQTIRKIVGFLNNADEDGGFWLPNIQRPFVWGEEQICRLFDSILREYPISTLLVWKTTSGIRRRKFIDNWSSSLKLSTFYVPEDFKKKCLVLDGQQRLQSLYIGLCGSFSGRELHFDVLSGTAALPDDIKYRFEFRTTATTAFPWVKFKDLVFTSRKKRELIQDMEAKAGRSFTNEEKDKIEGNLDLVDRTFKMDESITYQELDSIDNPDLYTEDDVVEVFIRANSGGTKLEKSDLLFSLLNATWDVADNRMEELLDDLNRHGFEFDRDFVLKTCLVLLNQGAQYEVSKFRKPGVREDIEEKWDELSASIKAIADFVRSKTYIQCDKALPSYLALIPLIYVRHHYPTAWTGAKQIDTFLVRTLLAGAFGGQSDRIIDALVKRFKEIERFDAEEGFAVIRSHVFPQSRLKAVKVTSPDTGRSVMKYRDDARNHLANCMLLTRAENGGGGKSDMSPADWFKDKDANYLDLHLIPKDKALWAMDRYEDFIAERKNLIATKFSWLIA